MTKRINQQAKGDCAVCALAMFLGKEHENLMNAFQFLVDRVGENEHGGLVERGGLTKTEMLFIIRIIKSRPPILIQNHWDVAGDRKKEIFEIIQRKKAILSAKSLNYPNVAHAVYWDGKKIIDPSNKKRYTKKTINPYEVIL